jgi:hypothetical protein
MKPAEKKLLKYYSKLTPDQRVSLLQFAEFLLEKGTTDYSIQEQIPEPVLKERPSVETVVAAIKRLTASYPMLDRDKLFNDTSSLMTRHVMQGEEAAVIIDELELLFQRKYQNLVEENSKTE